MFRVFGKKSSKPASAPAAAAPAQPATPVPVPVQPAVNGAGATASQSASAPVLRPAAMSTIASLSSFTHGTPMTPGTPLGMHSLTPNSAATGPGLHGHYDATPQSDVALPVTHSHSTASSTSAVSVKRRSSVVREEKAALLNSAATLPPLKDTPIAKREAALKQKLQLCSVTDFVWVETAGAVETDADRQAKELKRATLVEMLEYVNTPAGMKHFAETVIPEAVQMVADNIFRALPSPAPSPIPGGDDVAAGIASGGEDGEEEPFAEPAWGHLQLVYELLLRLIVSAEVKAKTAKKYIDATFCSRLIDMFASEDVRERDYLKTILHRIYGKFMSHRGFVRKSIANAFYRFVYETDRHHGIAELLEILGSVINGFALPLKPEHVTFLEKALIPLHRPRSIAFYFQQLCYCVTQYIEKDPSTTPTVLRGLLKAWPWTSSAKQIVFLNEIEEILELAGPEAVEPVLRPLFRTLGRCVGSTHFQVAERALFLWNNDQLLTAGVLSKQYTATALPLLFLSLQKNANGHWNTTVETMAQNVLKHYQDADPGLFDRCTSTAGAEALEKQHVEEERSAQWARIAAQAAALTQR